MNVVIADAGAWPQSSMSRGMPSEQALVGAVTTAICCRALVKSFGPILAVNGLDLDVYQGECFGLLGPNGAGKTTTLEILEGLQRSTSGTLTLFGLSWNRGRDRELRERIGVVLQDAQLAERLTVSEVFGLFRSFYGKGPTTDDLLRSLRLEGLAKRHYASLSAGQKQRVAIGSALAGQPDLLFLDEPTTGLDPHARQTLWKLVEDFRGGGGTVLLTTHYMEEAAALCDRIAIMSMGRVIAAGTPRSLIEQMGHYQIVEFSAALEASSPAATELSALGALQIAAERCRLRTQPDVAALRAALDVLTRHAVPITGLTVHQATLEDVYLELTGRAASPTSGGASEGKP